MKKFLEYITKLDELVEENPQFLYSDQMVEEMKNDFKVFMHFAWKDSFGFTPHLIQYHFADMMQQGVGGRTVLCALREFGKTITDATFINWLLFRDPNFTVLVVSANKPRAREITGMALGMIKACSFMSHMVPGKDDLDGREAFTVGNRTRIRKEASCVSTSITAGNTGAHADLILTDDMEIPKNSDTQTKRQALMEGIDEYTYILNKGGTELFIGTPQTNDSVYWKMKATGNYNLFRVPAEYPDVLNEDGMDSLAPFLLEHLRENEELVGLPTYPERFSAEDLAVAKAKSPATYARQMLLDPSIADESKYPLKLRDFIVMDLNPLTGPRRVMWGNANPRTDIDSPGKGKDMFYGPNFVDWEPTPYEHSVIGIDSAGNGPDEVGFCVGKKITGQVFITAAGGIDGGYDEPTLKRLAKIIIEQGVKEIRLEKTMVDEQYGMHLTRVLGSMGISLPIKFVPAVGQKEIRMLSRIEPALAQHKIIVDTKVARDSILMGQISDLTEERGALIHDDRVNALDICLSAFEQDFLIDADQLISDNSKKDFQEEVKSFITVPTRSGRGTFIGGSKNTKSSRRRYIR